MQSHWNIYFACSEVTCLGAFSRESNGARTHIDVKRQKRSGHWTSLVTSYGTSFDHPNLNIWPYVYTAALWTRTTYEQRCQIRNQNRNKPELSVADCILLQMLYFSGKYFGIVPQKFPDSFELIALNAATWIEDRQNENAFCVPSDNKVLSFSPLIIEP